MCQIKDAVKETSDLGLRRLGERGELIQSQLQKDFEKQLEVIDLNINKLKSKILQKNCDHSALLAHQTATPSNNSEFAISCDCQNNAFNTCKTTPHQPVAVSGLNSSDVLLPLFNENSEVNPVSHLKRLDKFLKLRGVPQIYHLTVACRSVVEKLSRQWLEAISDKPTDYETFRNAFLSIWWSAVQQSLVKFNIYQTKYNRRSNLSYSGHFLKYTTFYFFYLFSIVKFCRLNLSYKYT